MTESTTSPRSGLLRDRRIGAGALLAILALVALIAWLVVDSRGGSPKPEAKSTVAIVSQSGLKTIAIALHQPIYWVGAQSGTKLELTQLPNRRIYVRYLPASGHAGDKGTFLTVGTYQMRNAFSILQAASKKPDAVPVAIGNGAIALYHRSNPQSVYVAYPGSDHQIEVYSPKAASARQLVATNRLRSVTAAGGSTGTGAVAASVAELKALSARLGRSVYWVGSQPNVTYELTQTSNGRIYIRYLPSGTPVGAHALFLTVGTYPVPKAFAVTRKAGKTQGAAIITLADGAVAIYKKRGSTHVYMAYPGSNQQIEVFDPTPDRARRLVAAARISPVR